MIQVADVNMEMRGAFGCAVGAQIKQVDLLHFPARLDPVENAVCVYVWMTCPGAAASAVACLAPAGHSTVPCYDCPAVRCVLLSCPIVLCGHMCGSFELAVQTAQTLQGCAGLHGQRLPPLAPHLPSI